MRHHLISLFAITMSTGSLMATTYDCNKGYRLNHLGNGYTAIGWSDPATGGWTCYGYNWNVTGQFEHSWEIYNYTAMGGIGKHYAHNSTYGKKRASQLAGTVNVSFNSWYTQNPTGLVRQAIDIWLSNGQMPGSTNTHEVMINEQTWSGWGTDYGEKYFSGANGTYRIWKGWNSSFSGWSWTYSRTSSRLSGTVNIKQFLDDARSRGMDDHFVNEAKRTTEVIGGGGGANQGRWRLDSVSIPNL